MQLLKKKHTDLVERSKSGDRSAQRDLYHQYASAMLNVSYRILQNKEEAEDVLQECFVKVLLLHSSIAKIQVVQYLDF